jgi:CO/xanthine dehydrogenase Mo-binding subunit
MNNQLLGCCLRVVVFIWALPFCGDAQAESTAAFELPRTQVVTIQDSGTKRTYELHIQLPKNYTAGQKYPVVYLTHSAYTFTITTGAACNAAQFKHGKTVSGRGIFLIPLSEVDPDTGEMTPVSCFAHAAMLIEIEVDDETGEVSVLDMQSAYEVGRALNPRLVEQQLVGGAWMGMSHALWETTEPYYPARDHGPVDFNQYLMPGPGDIAPHHISVLERPAPDGPYGGKGPGEMCANPVLPAIANAVYDAVGVRIDDLPITPEKILRGLRAIGGAKPRNRLGAGR